MIVYWKSSTSQGLLLATFWGFLATVFCVTINYRQRRLGNKAKIVLQALSHLLSLSIHSISIYTHMQFVV